MAAKLKCLVAVALLFALPTLNEGRMVSAHGAGHAVTAEEAIKEADSVVNAAEPVPAMKAEDAKSGTDDNDLLSSNLEELQKASKSKPETKEATAEAKTTDVKPEPTSSVEEATVGEDNSQSAVPVSTDDSEEEGASALREADQALQDNSGVARNPADFSADEVEEMEENKSPLTPTEANPAPPEVATLAADEIEELEEKQEDKKQEQNHGKQGISLSQFGKEPVVDDANPVTSTDAALEAELDSKLDTELGGPDEPPKPPSDVVALPIASSAQDFLTPVVAQTASADASPLGLAEGGTLSPATKDMENTVANLLKTKNVAAFFATPMGGTIKILEKLISEKMLPKINEAHNDTVHELERLIGGVNACGEGKETSFGGVNAQKALYKKYSPLHKECRDLEAVKLTSYTGCAEELKDKEQIKNLKCAEFAKVSTVLGDQNANIQVVVKSGSESLSTYVRRITATVCGGSGGKGGMLDTFLKHEKACDKATKEWTSMRQVCNQKKQDYVDQKSNCDNLQDKMDFAACERTVLVKDACEVYAECYTTKLEAYNTGKVVAQEEEKERKTEWRALNRMLCYIRTFSDGNVTDAEVKACKEQTYDTNHLILNYFNIPKLELCTVPDLYPSTPSYKKAEFTPLPTLAKGKEDANECVGVLEISTKPKGASPKGCKCKRVTMNGPFSPGPMVRCDNCLDVRRTTEENSCPEGTKIFSPRSAKDWRTFIASARPIRDPNWIIDVTKPKNGCGGCQSHPMNSEDKVQGKAEDSWRTSDNSPWWLRSTKYNRPDGDYHANCFLDLWMNPKDENHVTFDDKNCEYHSKSYYCQPFIQSTVPAEGSPTACTCTIVALTGSYSPGPLIKCNNCIDVSKTTDKSSCPIGTKIFSPRTQEDWKTVIGSTKPLRQPNFIIDVTRPEAGCGGCDKYSMNSDEPAQATWTTSDGSAWWLRSTKYTEPNGDYEANCYMDLWHPAENSDSVTFDDKKCEYHSTAYFCQPIQKKKKASELVEI